MRSMTGFARAGRQGRGGELALELRSVNHRFLDLKLTMPDALGSLETILRTELRRGLGRGRVDATLRWRPPPGQGLVIDEALAGEVARTARHLGTVTGDDMPVARDALALLAWPGVVEQPAAAYEVLRPELETVAREAVERLCEARAREGAELAGALAERLGRLETLTGELGPALADSREALTERLAARLKDLGPDIDEVRVAQEAAVLAVRQDASEELDRLRAHVREARRLLDAAGPVGRRLDFLMQELAREANTLASKAPDLETNRLALDCKVAVEEMREQVQNVE